MVMLSVATLIGDFGWIVKCAKICYSRRAPPPLAYLYRFMKSGGVE